MPTMGNDALDGTRKVVARAAGAALFRRSSRLDCLMRRFNTIEARGDWPHYFAMVLGKQMDAPTNQLFHPSCALANSFLGLSCPFVEQRRVPNQQKTLPTVASRRCQPASQTA